MHLDLTRGVVVHRDRADKFTTERAWWLKVNQALGGGWEVQDFHGGCFLSQGKTRLTRTDIRPLADEWATRKVILEKT